MRLRALTNEDCEIIRRWRNDHLEGLRTPYPLTKAMQMDFYDKVISNRQSPHRYWAVEDGNGDLVGMVGLTGIQWENRLAEISLITDPAARGRGLGSAAVDLVLREAFEHLNLQTVFGECYHCNANALGFWKHLAETRGWYTTTLPCRKWWGSRYWDSLYFSVDRNCENIGEEPA